MVVALGGQIDFGGVVGYKKVPYLYHAGLCLEDAKYGVLDPQLVVLGDHGRSLGETEVQKSVESLMHQVLIQSSHLKSLCSELHVYKVINHKVYLLVIVELLNVDQWKNACIQASL